MKIDPALFYTYFWFGGFFASICSFLIIELLGESITRLIGMVKVKSLHAFLYEGLTCYTCLGFWGGFLSYFFVYFVSKRGFYFPLILFVSFFSSALSTWVGYIICIIKGFYEQRHN
mgnify:CR=1 FL=1